MVKLQSDVVLQSLNVSAPVEGESVSVFVFSGLHEDLPGGGASSPQVDAAGQSSSNSLRHVVCRLKEQNKLTVNAIYTVLLCLYVADPATFLASVFPLRTACLIAII